MSSNNPTKGIDTITLRRYLEARKVIDERVDRISNVTHLLSLLKYCGENTVPVSPHALASMAEMVYSDTCKIIETLDDFIYITDAEMVLKESKG